MTERPNVLHLTTTGAIAGAEQLLVGLSKTHDRSIWNVSYATLMPPGPMNEKVKENGAPCSSFSVRSAADIPRAIILLAAMIENQRIAILHSHLLHPGLIGIAAARLARSRSLHLIHTRHHSDELHRFGPKWKARLDQFVAKTNEIVCANSLAAQQVLIDLESVDPSKIRLNYPGVDVSDLRMRAADSAGVDLRRELNLPPNSVLIVSVAHLLPKKGHAVLIEAMDEVVKHFPSACLVIAGRGPEEGHLKELIESKGLSDNVRLLGERNDIPNVITAGDLVVQPSLEEGFGLAVVEAMVLGKAVVGSRTGGLTEVMIDHETGLLAEPGDAGDLASKLMTLIGDTQLRSCLGDAGAARAESEFTIERHARQYEAVWTEVLKR